MTVYSCNIERRYKVKQSIDIMIVQIRWMKELKKKLHPKRDANGKNKSNPAGLWNNNNIRLEVAPGDKKSS